MHVQGSSGRPSCASPAHPQPVRRSSPTLTPRRPPARAHSTKARFEKVIRAAQDSICKHIEEMDGTKFRQDAWTRADGGGGITRVIQDGKVFEKAGVNVSVVYGSMPPEAYR